MNEMKELKLQAEVDSRVGRLVEIGEAIITKLGRKIGDIKEDQIRNVIAVANSAPHPAIVTNFIHYQMGRKGSPGDAWKGTGLGYEVIKAIDGEVRHLAEEADQKAMTNNVSGVQVQMMRLLLGFMNRSYVYERDKYQDS